MLLKDAKFTRFITAVPSLSYLGPKIRDLLPLEPKRLEILEIFKLKIKNWTPFECPYGLCRLYKTSWVSLKQ